MSSDSILSGALVSIASAYAPTVPLAVGKLLLDSKDIKEDEKGKAVHVLHTWKDALWQSGKKGDPPTDVPNLKAAREAHAKTSEGAGAATGGAGEVSDVTTQLKKTAISSTVEADPITAEGTPTRNNLIPPISTEGYRRRHHPARRPPPMSRENAPVRADPRPPHARIDVLLLAHPP